MARLNDPATNGSGLNDDIGEQKRLELYRLQVVIREAEQRAYDLFLQNLVKGTSHLSLGQEAVAAGFGHAMRYDDFTFCTYRGHAHTLTRGAAWAAKERGTGQVSVCFFGDGTTNIGAFHEALNLAAVWELPVVFVCENNLYMEYTPIQSVTAVENPAADRAAAYGLEALIVDGNDVEEVYGIATVYIERARQGGGPALIEAKTYRKGGHSRADPAKYRPEKEVEEWLARDALDMYRARLGSSGVDEGVLEKIESEVIAMVDRATDEAKSAPPPSPSLLETNVWADGGSAWRN